MKAKLVIEMPSHCLYCPCHKPDPQYVIGVCLAKVDHFENYIDLPRKISNELLSYERPGWCPLIPMEDNE